MTEKTLSQLLDEYNNLGNEHLQKTAGFSFRPRSSFKDKADAISSMNRLQSSIKANEEGIAKMVEQEEASTTEIKEMATPKKKAPAKKKTNGAARGRRSTYGPDQKIVVVAKENPRREGTAVFKQFELAKKHGTVGAYLKAGGSLGSLRKSVKKGWMRVSG
jgi:hypothetical protein